MTSADASRPERRLPWRVAAWAWLAICLVVAVHQFSFWRSTHFDTDVMALLPQDEQAPEVGRATRQLADQVTRQVVVMIGAPDWAGARKAADAWERAAMQGDRATAPPPLRRSAMASDASLRDTLAFYAPYRDRLLTPAQRAELELAPPGALVQGALGALAQPGGGFRLADWNADPLALWPQWWLARASDTRARPRDGQLALRDGGLEWVVLLEETTGAAFSLSGDEPVSDVVEKGREAARAAVPGARVLAGGVPLFAEHAAARAHLEVNTIGWGSVGGVLVLVFLAFRSLWPRLLMALSLLVGVAMALSATAWVFGHVHLLTTVFGASLVGCAEDYGLYYFASRQGAPAQPPLRLMGTLLPGLGLALLTSVLGYVALGLPPFPGLRQMALFSVVGIAGAFMTTVCWFPWIDRGSVRATRFSAWIVDSFPRYPRFAAGRGAWLMHAAVLAACAIGIAQLRVDDDLRQLQGSPKTLVDTQREIGRLLGLASPAQFFVVRGSSADDVLRREEALKARLDARVANGELAGYRALSDWVPSAARQAADAALTKRVEEGVIAGVDRGPRAVDRRRAARGRRQRVRQRRDAARRARPRGAAWHRHERRRPARRALGRPGAVGLGAARALSPHDGPAARRGPRRRAAGARLALRPPCLARLDAHRDGHRRHAGAAGARRPAAAAVQRACARAAAGHRHRLRHLPARTRGRRRGLGLAVGGARRGQHLAVVRPARAFQHAGAAFVRLDASVRHPHRRTRRAPLPAALGPRRTAPGAPGERRPRCGRPLAPFDRLFGLRSLTLWK